MGSPDQHQFAVPGHELLRVLSDREQSKLFLGRGPEGGLVAVKLEQPRTAGRLEKILARYRKLQGLTARDGFIRILGFGALDDGWVWHSMPLADNLPGLAPLNSEDGLQHYTPLTLASWIIENGPASASQAATWGQRICLALGILHEAGLVHRDVKPSNLVFVNGAITLADYGLVGEPGSEADLIGTQGFIPLEGTSDPGADLFALGKTLYQAFSGKDPMEFPSLPSKRTSGVDWEKRGRGLNAIILQACHAQPRRRFGSAQEFATALNDVMAGTGKVSRRFVAKAMGGASLAAMIAAVAYRRRPLATVVWTTVRTEGFNLEAWEGHIGTADWARGRIYSIAWDLKGRFWLSEVNLATFETRSRRVEPAPQGESVSMLHPVSGRLWAVEGGRGEVYEADVDTGTVRKLGGGPNPEVHYKASLYWNPVTGRVGSFGGYGRFRVNNKRHEFDERLRQWIEVKESPGGPVPWPRTGQDRSLIAGSDPTRIFMEGGSGSPSGIQAREVKGLRGFNSQFHNLDDVWELDLKSNRWTELLPNARFPEAPDKSSIFFYHPKFDGLVLLKTGIQSEPNHGRVTAWLLRPGVDRKPLLLPQRGIVPRLLRVWAYTFDPRSHDLLVLAANGIFRVRLE